MNLPHTYIITVVRRNTMMVDARRLLPIEFINIIKLISDIIIRKIHNKSKGFRCMEFLKIVSFPIMIINVVIPKNTADMPNISVNLR